MSIGTIETALAPKAIGPYAQAVRANGFLFTAGQIPLDPHTMEIVTGDVTAQTEQVLANLTAVLEAAGTGWAHVVKTTVFLRDMTEFGAMNTVYARVLGEARRYMTDTLPSDFVVNGTTLKPTGEVVGKYSSGLAKTRRLHVEDWVAVLAFNHLFAGADAFVAAQLWDVPVSFSAVPSERGPFLVATLRF